MESHCAEWNGGLSLWASHCAEWNGGSPREKACTVSENEAQPSPVESSRARLRQGKAGQGWARQGEAGQGRARRAEAGQGRARRVQGMGGASIETPGQAGTGQGSTGTVNSTKISGGPSCSSVPACVPGPLVHVIFGRGCFFAAHGQRQQLRGRGGPSCCCHPALPHCGQPISFGRSRGGPCRSREAGGEERAGRRANQLGFQQPRGCSWRPAGPACPEKRRGAWRSCPSEPQHRSWRQRRGKCCS